MIILNVINLLIEFGETKNIESAEITPVKSLFERFFSSHKALQASKIIGS